VQAHPPGVPELVVLAETSVRSRAVEISTPLAHKSEIVKPVGGFGSFNFGA